jgi:predicted nucleotidyltransferase
MGRDRWTEDGADIDFFVKAQDTLRTLAALEEAGFLTREVEPHWLSKATKDHVVVDVIYRSSGDIYLDDEMVERSFEGQFKGVPIRLAAAEDLIVMKAIAHREETGRYWHDALGILGRADLDWEYLLRRARQYGARRVLSLLVYAQSNDIAVPNHAVRDLFASVYEE